MRQLLKLQSEIQHEQKLQDDQSMQQQQLPVLQLRNELIARRPSKAGEQWTQNSQTTNWWNRSQALEGQPYLEKPKPND